MQFGEYVKKKRIEKGITLRSFSELVGIAPSYMSDIEKAKRNAPTQEYLDKICEILELNNEERDELYDLAAKSKDTIAADLTQYVSENPNLRVALRKAKNFNMKDEEWIKVIEKIIKENR